LVAIFLVFIIILDLFFSSRKHFMSSNLSVILIKDFSVKLVLKFVVRSRTLQTFLWSFPKSNFEDEHER
jgi:hypothetical protein